MTLLVIWILGADYHNSAVSLDDLAFVAHRFNTGSDFHFEPPKVRIFYFDLLVAVDNSSLSQVIGRHFDFHLVAFEDSDVVDTQFSAEIREYFVSVVEYYSELGFRQNLNHFAFGFDYVFL